MNERERWIVYPLLFLALGVALRDKLSEQTNTKLIRCQELVVTGEEIAGQEGAMLVHIGAVKRTAADSPHLGQITVNGLVQANEIHAEVVLASNVNANNYFFRQLPFGPLLLGEIMRVLQQQAAGAVGAGPNTGSAPATSDKPTPPATVKPAAEAESKPAADSTPPAE